MKIKHGFNEELNIWTVTAHGHCADRGMNEYSQFTQYIIKMTNIYILNIYTRVVGIFMRVNKTIIQAHNYYYYYIRGVNK